MYTFFFEHNRDEYYFAFRLSACTLSPQQPICTLTAPAVYIWQQEKNLRPKIPIISHGNFMHKCTQVLSYIMAMHHPAACSQLPVVTFIQK